MIFDFSKNWFSIKHGEIAALRELFNETNQSLLNYSFRISQDKHIAEEVVQDVFINIWNNRELIDIKGSVKSYLFQSVHNYTINKLIKNKTQRNSLAVLVSEEAWQYIEANYEVNDYLIEKLESEDTEKLIHSIVEELPQQCREIFFLSRYEGLTNSEIAHKLNVSLSTVKTQIYRALDKIKQQLF
jgi:RNA polymerase sigma-70 factor (ECF subfamily)